MSLSSPYQEHYYVADGVTTTFAFGSDFTALSSSYVKCIIYFEDGTNCVPTFNVDLTTGYINIVTLTKPDGTVLTVPPAGSIVRVFRDVPEQQNVTASQLQNYTAKQLEKIFDSVVAMIQEVSYSDLHKTIRLTETQRDVAVEQLTEEKDQSILYWDFESHTLKATDYGQDEVVKSETVDRLVYLQPEGKIYFIPKGSNNPIAIGSATIHNDLGGRNAPDCHPESAITNLTTHLQELRDKDTEIDGKADYAVSTADDAKDLATTAKNTADAAYEKAEETERAVQGFDDRITQAEEDSAYAKEAVDEHITDKDNPHEVTKDQVGLGNCDNTSDEDKPISTATQSALDLKMPISTKYGAALSLTINSTNYVVTAQLKDQDGNNLGTAQTIDLPLESVVVSGAYDSATKEVVLTLQDGSKIRFSVADLVSGLQTEITALNMLSADLVDDTSTTHKFVTTTEKTTWNNKQNAISDLATIRSNAQAGKAASDTIATYGNIVTHNVSEFATATQGAKADTAVQPADLATVATSGSYNDLSDKPTIPADISAHRVNGAPLSNSTSVFYGVSTSAKTVVDKIVSIPSITTLDVGTAILVKPTVTSTVANSGIKLNDFPAYPMRYVGAAITTSTDSIVWAANTPSLWIFDGEYWVFAGHGVDTNTTYSAMSVAEGIAGTATSSRTMTAAYTKQIIQGTTLTDIDVTTTGAVTDTDSITGGIGKLQATKADKSEIPTVNNPTITITQGGVTKGSFTLNQATGDTIALDAGGGGGSVDIDNTTITKNSDDEIQTVATINANTATGATNPIYDWVGTLAEYNAQNIETLHPDWVCYITDDFAAQTYEAYTKTQANQLLDNKVGYCSFNENTKVQITTSDQTAAKNGWLIGVINFSGNNQQTIIYVNSIVVARGGWAGGLWMAASVQIPIKAGQTFRYDCTGTIQNNQMYFYPDD